MISKKITFQRICDQLSIDWYSELDSEHLKEWTGKLKKDKNQ